jgi:hypothetical protein
LLVLLVLVDLGLDAVRLVQVVEGAATMVGAVAAELAAMRPQADYAGLDPEGGGNSLGVQQDRLIWHTGRLWELAFERVTARSRVVVGRPALQRLIRPDVQRVARRIAAGGGSEAERPAWVDD